MKCMAILRRVGKHAKDGLPECQNEATRKVRWAGGFLIYCGLHSRHRRRSAELRNRHWTSL
jgi:hypothetical protein